MITSKLLLCCSGAVRDVQSNNISVFNIIEQLAAVSFPFFIQRLHIVAYLQREESDDQTTRATLEIKIDDQVLEAHPIDLAFGEKLKTRLMTELVGLAIPQPGSLDFSLKVGSHVVNSWKVEVKSNQSPQLEIKEL